MKPLIFLMIVGCVIVSGCSDSREQAVAVEEPVQVAQWAPVSLEDMSETQMAQHDLCVAATNAMASELMGELMAALDSDGPAAGITVCGQKAPAIAKHIAEDYGVRIGRTSHKLRNPVNTPPQWAEKVVADQLGQPTYLTGPHGEFGALLPIRLKAECQMCHGTRENIDETILTALGEHYPEDMATGFAEGDLRGWFWVEAPGNTTTS